VGKTQEFVKDQESANGNQELAKNNPKLSGTLRHKFSKSNEDASFSDMMVIIARNKMENTRRLFESSGDVKLSL
jgi:hypothetical protein